MSTPFQLAIDDLTHGCGCACHAGVGYRTACVHCAPRCAPPIETVRPNWRTTDPDTSRAAGAKQRGGAEAAILALDWPPEGLTADEVCERLPEHYDATLKSALSRLHPEHLRDSGRREPSRRGALQIVWVRA